MTTYSWFDWTLSEDQKAFVDQLRAASPEERQVYIAFSLSALHEVLAEMAFEVERTRQNTEPQR